MDTDELLSLPILGADLSFVTAFFSLAPFLISPRRAFLSGVIFGKAAVALPVGGIPIGGGGGGGGGGGSPMLK